MGRPAARRLAKNPLVVLLLVAALLVQALGRRLSAESEQAQDNSGCKPRQVHLALTGDPTQLLVSWKTKGKGCPSQVDFWLRGVPPNRVPGPLQQTLGVSAEYDNKDFCASPARDYDFDGPQYIHHATLTGLTPGARYNYRVAGAGEEVPFRAPQAPGPDASFTFLAYGDMGESEHAAAKSPGAADTQAVVRREVDEGAELIMHVGDISYANGRPEVWDTFMGAIQPFASRVPYMVAIGNHEYLYKHGDSSKDPSGADEPYDPEWSNFGNDSGGECGVATAKTFQMPDTAELGYWPEQGLAAAPTTTGRQEQQRQQQRRANPTLGPNGAAFSAGSAATAVGGAASAAAGNKASRAPNPPFWYSFSYGSVHFTVLSTEHDAAPGSDQFAWLEHDLRRVDRCKTPWLVVAMHRPMYVVFPHKSNRIVGEHLRQQLEGLFEEYEVDLVLTGHVHSYSRTCNVRDWECVDPEEGGMTHVTVGSAGRKLSDVEYEQPDWLDYAASRFGFGRVTVNGADWMRFDFVASDDGEVHDSVTLHNKRTGRRGCNAAAAAADSDGTAMAAGWKGAAAQQQTALGLRRGGSGGAGAGAQA